MPSPAGPVAGIVPRPLPVPCRGAARRPLAARGGRHGVLADVLGLVARATARQPDKRSPGPVGGEDPASVPPALHLIFPLDVRAYRAERWSATAFLLRLNRPRFVGLVSPLGVDRPRFPPKRRAPPPAPATGLP